MATSESVPSGLIKSLNLVKIAEAAHKLDDKKVRRKHVNVVMTKDQAPSGFIVVSRTEVQISAVYPDFTMEDQEWTFTDDLSEAARLLNEKN
jgi:hypothetical protein